MKLGKVLEQKSFDSSYIQKLWKLTENFPIEELHINTFDSIIKDWLTSEVDVTYTDKTVVKLNYDHFERIRNANLLYPIILGEDGRVLDGMHRVLKVWFSGKNVINAVRFERDPA